MFLKSLACKILSVPPQELGHFSEEVVGQVKEDEGQPQEVEGHGNGAGVVEERQVNPCQTRGEIRRSFRFKCLKYNLSR